jgi:hypothetical protein
MSDTATSVQSPSAQETSATNAGDTAVLENAPAADAAATDAGLGGDGQSNPDAGDELLARLMGIDTGADADAAESTPEPEGKAGAVVLSDEEAIAARTVLARLGWDAEDILAMSPAKLKAKADKYGAHVARTDEAFKSVKKLAQVQKELEDLRAKTAPDPLAGFKAKYASLIDPEDLEALAGVVKVKAKAQTKPEADDVARTSAELFITDPRNAASRTAEMWARLKGSA